LASIAEPIGPGMVFQLPCYTLEVAKCQERVTVLGPSH